MKKIIIAAISVLVGSFGYTIVDTALETRVAVLESEMQIIREEVSNYHPNRPDYTADPDDYRTTIKEEIPSYNPPTAGEAASMGTTKPNNSLYVGREFSKAPGSISKFLVVVYDNGAIEYISPAQYNDMLNPQTTRATTTPSDSDDIETSAESTEEESTKKPQPTHPPISESNGQYFVYLTDVSAVITNVTYDTDYSYSYDNNYSLISTPQYKNCTYSVTITYKGYTNPILSQNHVVFTPYLEMDCDSISIEKLHSPFSRYTTLVNRSNNIIGNDGKFEYSETYMVQSYGNYNPIDPTNSYNLIFSITSLAIQ